MISENTVDKILKGLGMVADAVENLRRCMELLDRRIAALVFNIPAATVAAWRAHATRGTYSKRLA